MECHKHTYAVPFHSNFTCTCTCTNAHRKTLSEEDGRNKRIELSSFHQLRHVTSRAINETHDFGQFYYSTRHAKKKTWYSSPPIQNHCTYMYTSHNNNNNNTHTHHICGKNKIPFLFRKYIIIHHVCIHTDPQLFFHSYFYPYHDTASIHAYSFLTQEKEESS